VLAARDIVLMATSDAAVVLGLETKLGHVAEGYKADLFVVSGDSAAPYDAILAANPGNVRLVMVGGVVLYGDASFESIAPAVPGCEQLEICGQPKFLCVAEDSTANLLDQTHVEIHDALEAGLQDLDGIPALDPAACIDVCASDEECYERTIYPVVDVSYCGGSCPVGESCFQRNTTTWECLSTNACAPRKTKAFSPLAPLVDCN